MFQKAGEGQPPRFAIGDRVRVASRPALDATFPQGNRLPDRLFMDQMYAYCGEEFTITQVVTTIYLENLLRLRTPLYILGGLRCHGQVGEFDRRCDRSCNLLWHESWLEPASTEPPGHTVPVAGGQSTPASAQQKGGICQFKHLPELAEEPTPYVNFIEALRKFLSRTKKQLHRLQASLAARQTKAVAAPSERLNTAELAPGDPVRVRPRAVIESMLDYRGTYQGCPFIESMYAHCGGTYRVLKTASYFYDELKGKVCKVKNLVVLEGTICPGKQKLYTTRCELRCLYFWHRDWLEALPPGQP